MKFIGKLHRVKKETTRKILKQNYKKREEQESSNKLKRKNSKHVIRISREKYVIIIFLLIREREKTDGRIEKDWKSGKI